VKKAFLKGQIVNVKRGRGWQKLNKGPKFGEDGRIENEMSGEELHNTSTQKGERGGAITSRRRTIMRELDGGFRTCVWVGWSLKVVGVRKRNTLKEGCATRRKRVSLSKKNLIGDTGRKRRFEWGAEDESRYELVDRYFLK